MIEHEQVCYLHPDRVAGVRCQRCERPICPTCMRQASVGFQCPECTRSGAQRVVTSRQIFGRGSTVVVAKALIGLNVAAFVLALVAPDSMITGVRLGNQGVVAVDAGVMFGPLVALGEWWRVLSGAFLHAGLLHLGMNMFLLWLLAQELEPALGRGRFTLLYVTSLLGGSLGVLVVSPLSPTVGASGAVFGLMGAHIAFHLRAKQNPMQSQFAGLVILNLMLTFLIPGISVGGHVGGLLAGAAAGAVLQPLRWPQKDAALRTAAVVLLAAAFGALAIAGAPTLVRAAL